MKMDKSETARKIGVCRLVELRRNKMSREYPKHHKTIKTGPERIS